MKLLALFMIMMSLALPVRGDIITIATWNIENLRSDEGQGQNPRNSTDYRRLADYALLLEADVIALQEIEDESALARVFDPEHFQFFVSSRHTGGKFRQRTAFAVRRGIPVTRLPDYVELQTGRGLRYGVDIQIKVAGRAIRLLSIHLKSFCFKENLSDDSTLSKDCRKLVPQLAVLETWIDERTQEGLPLVVIGDFNRRLNLVNDDFWSQIDDGVPPELQLFRATAGSLSKCWNGKYPDYIDHIVYNRQIADWVVPESFRQVLYKESSSLAEALSDHCPISVTLDVR